MSYYALNFDHTVHSVWSTQAEAEATGLFVVATYQAFAVGEHLTIIITR